MKRARAREPFGRSEPIAALTMSDVHKIPREEARRVLDNGGFFLVLRSEPWRRFAAGTKTVEVRRAIAQYQKIQPGRFGVLRRGHNGEDLFAACASRLDVANLAALPRDVRARADLTLDRAELTA